MAFDQELMADHHTLNDECKMAKRNNQLNRILLNKKKTNILSYICCEL